MIHPARNALPAFLRSKGIAPVRLLGPALCLSLALSVTGCDGDNLFGGQQLDVADDAAIPTVEIERPGSGTTSPRGDSLLVEVDLRDDVGIESVRIRGEALRGDPTLGTDEIVPRYDPREVVFEPAQPDTLLQRYLQPIDDGTSEPVFIIAEAVDLAGNVVADTVEILVGAPRVVIPNLSDGDTVQAGRDLAVRVEASDEAAIDRVTLDYEGVTTGTISETFSPPVGSVTVDTIISLPDQTGTLAVVASAHNTFGQTGRTDILELVVSTVATTDTIPPSVALDVHAPPRMELLDSIRVTVDARDDTQGSGIATIGMTALAMDGTGADTLVYSEAVSYPTPRTGNVFQDFRFTPEFRADTLSLPDSLVFEIHAWAVDDAGNCAAGTEPEPQSEPCGTYAGETVVEGVSAEQHDVITVTGHTIELPDGGVIADAAVDLDTAEARYRLYLSNMSENAVEVVNLTDSAHVGSALVGAQPWGLFLDNSGDTLLVANSGGTNISYLPLETGGDPTAVPVEDLGRRLLTPNTVLYQIAFNDDEGTYTVDFFDFSDRPQFVAQDSTGKYLYSTVPTPSAADGTLRLVDEDPDPGGTTDLPEAEILFDEVSALESTEDVTAIANLDSIVVNPDPAGIDGLAFCDHTPGYPDDVHCESHDPQQSIDQTLDDLRAATGDDRLFWRANASWVPGAIGMSDTTFVSATGDRGIIAFGEGATAPTGRIILWHAHTDVDQARVSDDLSIIDLVNNASERVLGVGLNQNGSLGVARGVEAAYYFDIDLRLQGQYTSDLGTGGAGADFHPEHDEVNETGEPALSFIATSRRSIQIVDATHWNERGEIAIRDNVVGPLRIVHPLPADNDGDGDACAEDHCIIAKVFGVTSSGGVVVVSVKRRDVN